MSTHDKRSIDQAVTDTGKPNDSRSSSVTALGRDGLTQDSSPTRAPKRLKTNHADDKFGDADSTIGTKDGQQTSDATIATAAAAAARQNIAETDGQIPGGDTAQSTQASTITVADDKKDRKARGDKRNQKRDNKGKPTFDKRAQRQQQQQAQGGYQPVTTTEHKERLPKKKVAMLVGYNGLGYKGSQINPGVPTLEGTIFEALIKAGAISEDNATDHAKVGLSRAARTDAGVHAAFNVLSLKLILAPSNKPAEQPLEEYLNTFLPSTIRIWSIVRVQGAFNPRTMCDQRQYEYTMPTHVLLGPKPGTVMSQWLIKCRAQAKKQHTTATAHSESPAASTSSLPEATLAAESATKEFWSTRPQDSTWQQDLVAKRAWRIPTPLVEALKAFVQAYEGSHNFYNYTVGKDFRDRSAQRLMRKLEVSEPFVVDDVEYISVGFLGQSFMLHQIRKMIGLAILAVRSGTPASLVAETFGPSRIHIPKAPALGLVLIGPEYQEYNKRIQHSNKKSQGLKQGGRISDKEADENMREAVGVEQESELLDKINQFKRESLYGPMREREATENVFSKWLNYLDVLIGQDFEYLNPKGVIPPSAVYQKGQDPEKNRLAPAAAPKAAGDNETDAALPGDEDDEDGELAMGADDG
ncbi:tRNA pseudouridine synthase 1 [Microbotryomycetes sp. JL221]|nr:tRNA pseudouridine synthase 1 [Microbotryomycetes sp. JL221]